MQAYRAVWGRCLNRVQSILRRLQAPVVDEVVTKIDNAYTEVLPGLPYPELPVVALHGANSSLVGDIADRLGQSREANPGRGPEKSQALQVHLYPAECASVMNMMKGIVTGFVDRSCPSKRTATSLANFDINLLGAWHTALPSRPTLVIFLHEFEKFDVKVVQDVMHIPELPLAFVLLMASPPSLSFLHSVYPRSTLALLRVDPVVTSSGMTMVKEVLEKTFFDPDFDSDVMLGPTMLEFIAEFTTRHIASPDALLAFMKHFSYPLSLLAVTNSRQQMPQFTEDKLRSSPELRPLVEALQVRILAATTPPPQTRSGSATPSTPRKFNRIARARSEDAGTAHGLLDHVSEARAEFHKAARRTRVAFTVARIAERIALGEVPVNAKGAEHTGRLDSIGTLSALLRGRAGNQIRYVCMAVRKLALPKLRELLHRLHAFLWDLQSAEVRREEEQARVWVVTQVNQLPPEEEGGETRDEDLPVAQNPEAKQMATALGDWLQTYVEERIVRFDEHALWDIWYTGNTPFPSELINPAPRPTVVSALLHPYDFIRAHSELVRATDSAAADGETSAQPEEFAREPELWELPDTSIAFRRYVDAGRMVNVYDWFESFAVVLEAQRRELRRRERAKLQRSSTQPNGKQPAQNGRGRRRGSRASASMDVDREESRGDGSEDSEEEMDEEEEERWKEEVQVRFLRALHELDYMGFVKHTGRKPDHVIRTIHDIPD
ncbi:hypothetical protein FKP32DRAFT_1584688 [Trametes sanguinea]|nr:hypothetical protein FKP32DRAFT_1584688 [Trametes sanguinea]